MPASSCSRISEPALCQAPLDVLQKGRQASMCVNTDIPWVSSWNAAGVTSPAAPRAWDVDMKKVVGCWTVLQLAVRDGQTPTPVVASRSPGLDLHVAHCRRYPVCTTCPLGCVAKEKQQEQQTLKVATCDAMPSAGGMVRAPGLSTCWTAEVLEPGRGMLGARTHDWVMAAGWGPRSGAGGLPSDRELR